MKYFTHELWSKINSDSMEEQNEASTQWDENDKAYSEIFNALKKDSLSKKFVETYLSNHGLHDYQIKNIQLTHKDYGMKSPVSVDIYVTDSINTWKITYKHIRKFIVNYEDHDYCDVSRGFDDWGYDEFLPLDEQTISHEILFASGSTILIHFKNRNIFITKVSDS